MPKILSLLRSSPCYMFQNSIGQLNNILKIGAQNICNVRFSDVSWTQLSHVVSEAGWYQIWYSCVEL